MGTTRPQRGQAMERVRLGTKGLNHPNPHMPVLHQWTTPHWPVSHPLHHVVQKDTLSSHVDPASSRSTRFYCFRVLNMPTLAGLLFPQHPLGLFLSKQNAPGRLQLYKSLMMLGCCGTPKGCLIVRDASKLNRSSWGTKLPL